MAEDKPGRGSDQFALRMPDGMRDRIKELAAENGRSMNAEIVAALSDHIERAEDTTWQFEIPLVFRDSLREIAEQQSSPVGYIVHEALLQFISRELSTDEERRTDIERLVTEIYDIVAFDLEKKTSEDE